MPTKTSVFDKTYDFYLEQIRNIDLISVADKLDLTIDEDHVTVLVFNDPYKVSKAGITDCKGKLPTFDISVILFKYLILCPDTLPEEKELVSYKDFKDSGPLITYFSNEVEQSVSRGFSGMLDKLRKACGILGGHSLDMDLSYDLMIRFEALSKIPIFIFFDDEDDEFPAKCSVLFERRAESYLDAECLAILGRLLFTRLSAV